MGTGERTADRDRAGLTQSVGCRRRRLLLPEYAAERLLLSGALPRQSRALGCEASPGLGAFRPRFLARSRLALGLFAGLPLASF